MSESDDLPQPDLSGQVLDRYRLIRRIGIGGMGAVYEAEHTHLRKRVAVKLLRAELARDESFRRRFLREARAASAVDHAHVVAISDSGETEDGHVFLAMELLTGQDLRQLLKEEPVLSWARAREILLQVTSALRAAHARKIVHRDIKPSNVFLVDKPVETSDDAHEDFVKLVDFGIAKLTGSTDESSAELTSPQQIVGTVAYISPEMAMGTKDDPRSDIYAVGVMMYRMLTGELPFGGGNALGILAQHVHAPIPSPREKQPSIPEAVEAIVVKAMAKKVDDRFADMNAFHRALRDAMPRDETVEPTQMLASIGLGEGGTDLGESTQLVDGPGDDTEGGQPPAAVATEGYRKWAAPVLGAAALALAVLWTTAGPDESPPKDNAVAVGAPLPPADPDPPPGDATSRPKIDATGTPAEPVIPDAGGATGSTSAQDDAAASSTGEATGGSETTGPGGSTGTGGKAETPERPPTKAPRKPRTDKQVVESLTRKIRNKCRGQLPGKVRVEGMVTSKGRVQSLLVTPQGGLGDCETIVKRARFDPRGGVRPMPRFSVEP
ncbi:MAG: serine/threonine-protein kinase [Myxococcota bacterium]